MVVHDHPVVAVLHIGEAVSGGQRLGLAILHVREGVIAGIDGGVAVHADQLISERDLDLRQRAKGTNEIGADGVRTGTHGGRQSPPQNALLGIERRDRIGVLLRQYLTPLCPCGSNVLLGPGPCTRDTERAQADQRHRHRCGVHVSPPIFQHEAIQASAELRVNGEAAHRLPTQGGAARSELTVRNVLKWIRPRVRKNSWPTTSSPAFSAARRSWRWCGSSCCRSWWA